MQTGSPRLLELAQSSDLSDAERTYRLAIRMHIPGEPEVGLSCRAHIAMIRDQASAGMRSSTAATYDLLNDISRFAQSWIYAPAAPAELWRIRSALEGMMLAARTAERVERRRAHGGG